MPAIGFRPRFAPPISAGRKIHTVRGKSPRGLIIGHWAPAYTGMRTKNVQLIGSLRISACNPIHIDPKLDVVVLNDRQQFGESLDWFARNDGFEDWSDMRAFWLNMHGPALFYGVIIHWSAFAGERLLGLAA